MKWNQMLLAGALAWAFCGQFVSGQSTGPSAGSGRVIRDPLAGNPTRGAASVAPTNPSTVDRPEIEEPAPTRAMARSSKAAGGLFARTVLERPPAESPAAEIASEMRRAASEKPRPESPQISGNIIQNPYMDAQATPFVEEHSGLWPKFGERTGFGAPGSAGLHMFSSARFKRSPFGGTFDSIPNGANACDEWCDFCGCGDCCNDLGLDIFRRKPNKCHRGWFGRACGKNSCQQCSENGDCPECSNTLEARGVWRNSLGN